MTARKAGALRCLVDAPYDDLVTTSTRFWNVSGISVDARRPVSVFPPDPRDTILLGAWPSIPLPGLPPGEKRRVRRHLQAQRILCGTGGGPFQYRAYFIRVLPSPLRGPEPGAPVEYRGIGIGRVQRILIKELAWAPRGQGSAIPVLIYLEPGARRATRLN